MGPKGEKVSFYVMEFDMFLRGQGERWGGLVSTFFLVCLVTGGHFGCGDLL